MSSRAEPGRREASSRASATGAPAPGILVVVGDLLEDIVVWATEPIRAATDSAAQVFRSRGGSAANVAAHAAGHTPTRFVGRVGDDGAGAALVSALAASGVDVRVQRAGRTGAVVLVVAPDGERTMFPDRAAAAELSDVDAAWLDDVAWLHVPSYGFEHEPMRTEVRRLIALARGRGAGISIDASSTGLLEGLGVERALGWFAGLRPDVLFANATEAELLGIAGGGEVAASVARRLVVKHGPRPTEVFDGGERTARVPVPPVGAVRDLTGAGDAFAAGYLAAAIGGADATASCVAGHAVAASVIASPGGDVN
ncbi:carbohydrate kinase family protein [Agromyces sp. M3QZ16-3]|uniref:carbohydrate kinase family protein n=1 Tax=Agromyces sp. M3QZ16-3 TaxID=3447585 RepID=UPI003F690493